nr:MAG TPA: hypothetical protein [Caudoviricetes sp.]
MTDLKICSIGANFFDNIIDFNARASLDEYEIINVYPAPINDQTYRLAENKKYSKHWDNFEYWKKQLNIINNKLIIINLFAKRKITLLNLYGEEKEHFCNYSSVPCINSTKIENSAGNEVWAANCNSSIKALYEWINSRDLFYFHVYMNQENYTPIFFTKNKQNKLGGIYKDEKHNNIYLFLPMFDLKILRYDSEREEYRKLLKDIYNEFFSTPASKQPEWVINNPDYLSKIEKDEQNKISENQKKIDEALQKIEVSKQLIEKEQNLKTLLYGQSHELEKGILEAMALIGFVNPHTYTTDSCEIDVLCNENDNPGFLLIGEAEGASKGTVNNKKINQLHTHVATYITENDVNIENLSISSVLFGNAFTAMPPEQRDQEYFGQHVYKIADLQNIKLVRTPDLFSAALYIKNTQNQTYAKQCYDLFFDGKSGQIEFPQHS